jgi:hypothetical protein
LSFWIHQELGLIDSRGPALKPHQRSQTRLSGVICGTAGKSSSYQELRMTQESNANLRLAAKKVILTVSNA